MIFNKLFFLALFFIGIFLLFRPTYDPDFGWHYKYGEYIFKNREILRDNLYSFTYIDYKWSNSYWIPQLIMYAFYTYLGPVYMSLILSGILSFLVITVLNNYTHSKVSIAVTAIIFFIFVGVAGVSVRPLYFSTIFFLSILYILLYKPTKQFLLVPIFLIWANSHADYLIGLFVYGLYTVTQLIVDWKNNKKVNILSNIVIPLAAVFITLVNPFSYHLWLTLLNEIHYTNFEYIAEFKPINSNGDSLVASNIFHILLPIFFSITILSVKLKRIRLGIWYALSTLVFFILWYRSVYFARHFITLSSFTMASILESLDFFIKNRINKFQLPIKAFGTVFLIFMLLISFQVFIYNFLLARSIKEWSAKYDYPYEAVNFIKSNRPEGNMFNHYNWGGYLIWQLPEYKTFIDGRMATWRTNESSIIVEHMNMLKKPLQNNSRIEKYFEEYDIRWVLSKPNTPIIMHLKEKGWEIIYEDQIAIVIHEPATTR